MTDLCHVPGGDSGAKERGSEARGLGAESDHGESQRGAGYMCGGCLSTAERGEAGARDI